MNDYWDTTADEAEDNGIWILMAGNWAVKRHPSVPPGELVRRLRRGARITQTSAANEAGLQRTRVSEIERGHADPRWSEIAALLGAVGCAPVLLASGKGWTPGIDRWRRTF